MGCCAVIVKILAATLLLVALIIGFEAHLASSWTKAMSKDGAKEACEKSAEDNKKFQDQFKTTELKTCPYFAIHMELFFISALTILFILSIVVMIIVCCVGQVPMKCCEAAYCVVAGILILLAGILMITAAVLIDKYTEANAEFLEKVASMDNSPTGTILKNSLADAREQRKEGTRYYNKLAAGCIAILDAFIYFIATCVICASWN